MTFYTAASTAFLQPAPGSALAPGPMTAPAEGLRHVLGIRSVSIAIGSHHLAVTDASLEKP